MCCDMFCCAVLLYAVICFVLLCLLLLMSILRCVCFIHRSLTLVGSFMCPCLRLCLTPLLCCCCCCCSAALAATYLVAKGRPRHVDLSAYRTASGKVLFSFLSLSWGAWLLLCCCFSCSICVVWCGVLWCGVVW